jgi:hypothetical protein
MAAVPGAIHAVPVPVVLLCLGLLGTAAEGEDRLPDLADYEPAEMWAFADLAGEDGIVSCTIGGEGLIEAPLSGTPCYMCRYGLTSPQDASLFLWGDDSAGPVYALAEGKRFQLENFTFEGAADFDETRPLGGEPAAWRDAWPDFAERTSGLESAVWEEWRLEPGRVYRFRVTELHVWYEGEVGHGIEWLLACLGPVEEGEDDD